MEQTPKRAKLDILLAKLPQNKLWEVLQILGGATEKHQQSGAFKRKTKKVFEPALQCFEKLELEALEGSPVMFFSAKLEPLLSYLCNAAPDLKQRFQAVQNDTLDVLLSADETTGGNVLATSQSKKVTSFYFQCVATG